MSYSIPARIFISDFPAWEPEPSSTRERRSTRRRGNTACRWPPPLGRKSSKPGEPQSWGQAERAGSSRMLCPPHWAFRPVELWVYEIVEPCLDSFTCVCFWKWGRGDFQPFRVIDSSCPCLDLRNPTVSPKSALPYSRYTHHHIHMYIYFQLVLFRFNQGALPLKRKPPNFNYNAGNEIAAPWYLWQWALLPCSQVRV